MDLYLMSQQKFLIGSHTGVSDVTQMFRKPIINTNIVSWVQPRYMDGDIYLLKLFKFKQTGEIVSIKEYLKNKLYLAAVRDEFNILDDYEVIDNSSEEILNATKEMYKMIFNNKVDFNQKEQQKFRNVFPVTSLTRISKSYISEYFLNKYKSELFNR
jgi:putative glycosyltransferase (TIGR04372 family)